MDDQQQMEESDSQKLNEHQEEDCTTTTASIVVAEINESTFYTAKEEDSTKEEASGMDFEVPFTEEREGNFDDQNKVDEPTQQPKDEETHGESPSVESGINDSNPGLTPII